MVVSLVDNSLFGMSLTGSDSCQGWEVELCVRTTQVAAMSPLFVMRHGANSMESEVLSNIKDVVDMRYQLLPYFYNLLHEHERKGYGVVRGLFEQFPEDSLTDLVNNQFMVGADVMVVGVNKAAQPGDSFTSLDIYFPKNKNLDASIYPSQVDPWYNLYDMKLVNVPSNGYLPGFEVTMNQIPVFVRQNSDPFEANMKNHGVILQCV